MNMGKHQNGKIQNRILKIFKIYRS